jgi:hypothetical protein
MTTLAQPLIGLFNGLRKVTFGHSSRIPSLAMLRLSDHDLADLNLPAEIRNRLDIEHARETRDDLVASINRYR